MIAWQIAFAVLALGQLIELYALVAMSRQLRDQAAKNEEARRQNQEDCSACHVGNVRNAKIAVGLAEQQKELMRMLTK
jgi:hypothetical protein